MIPIRVGPEAKAKFDALYARGRFVAFTAYGPWEAVWRHRGLDTQLMAVLDEPGWCAEMFAAHTTLFLEILQRCLDLGMKPDGIFLPEDMGFKTSLLLGVRTWDALLRPCYERIGAFARRHGIRFLMHSDGRVLGPSSRACSRSGSRPSIPSSARPGWISPSCAGAFPRRMTCFGNLSVANLLGERDALELELQRKIPFATGGGFINSSIHPHIISHSCTRTTPSLSACTMTNTAGPAAGPRRSSRPQASGNLKRLDRRGSKLNQASAAPREETAVTLALTRRPPGASRPSDCG